MKMICDVPDEVIKSVRMGTWCGSGVTEKMIANGIPIFDNATNGDIIKTLYPRTRDFATGLEHLGVEVRIDEFPSKLTMNVDNDWWNAPYQKGGKE